MSISHPSATGHGWDGCVVRGCPTGGSLVTSPGDTAWGVLPWGHCQGTLPPGSPPTAAPLGLIWHRLSCTISTLSELMDAKRPVFILEALGKALSKTIHSSGFRGGNMIKEICFQRVLLGKKKISAYGRS